MEQAKITFIGCGNMGTSLVGGLIKNGYPKEALCGADSSPEQRDKIEQLCGITTFEDNSEACSGSDVIVLAVKPQVMIATIKPISQLVQDQKSLIISIAAGIPLSSLSHHLGRDAAIIRVMPNTPSLIQAGVSGLFSNDRVSKKQEQLAETILNAVGSCVWVDKEELIDAVTAVSGSGPAYYFLFMEIMEKTAMELGLNKKQAQELVLQTALGASMMAEQSTEAIATLRQRVTSPGGTTEAALNTLCEGGFEELINRALIAARERAIEMANLFAEEKEQ